MISLIHPSRGRPKKAVDTAIKWVRNSGIDVTQIDYILSLDSSDPKLNEYWIEWDCEIIKDNKSVVEATNRAAVESKGDILIYLSDDFDCPNNWAQLVIEEFKGATGPMLLKVDDCLQKFQIPVLTIPIMNRELYELLGYFWHPDYQSMFCDVDLYYTVQKLGALKFAPHLKFPHNHVSIGKAENDETYRRSASNWNQGQEVFNRRKAAGFPV